MISVPAKAWLEGKGDKEALVVAIEQANEECGSCGCELDPLYKKALDLLYYRVCDKFIVYQGVGYL